MTTASVPPAPPRRWLRRLVFFAAALLILLGALYVTATSTWFLQSQILPRVSHALDAAITVEGADIHPFSSVTLRGVRVEAAGDAPLLQVAELRARYSLRDILAGRINVAEVTLVSPVVHVVQNADGTFNFTPLVKATGGEAGKPASPAPPKSAPPQLDVKSLAVNNATFRFTQHLLGGATQQAELSAVNLTVDGLKNAAAAKIGLGANLKLDCPGAPPAAARNLIAATRKSALNVGLDAALQPQSAAGDVTVGITQASGDFKDLSALNAALALDWTPKEIKQFALRFTRAGQSLGEVRASGPLDVLKQEGRLKLDIAAIDRNVLNLVGAPLGLDFGSTTVNASLQAELANAAKLISARGSVELGKLSVTRAGQTTPSLDVKLGFSATVDQTKQTALVQSFTLDGTQAARPLLAAKLAQPMNLAWGAGAGAVQDSAFELTVTKLDLADWRAFTSNTITGGKVDVTLKVDAQNAGRKLVVDLNTKLAGLTGRLGTNALPETTVTAKLRAALDDFERLTVSESSVAVGGKMEAWATPQFVEASVIGSYNRATQEADLQTGLRANLPRVASLLALTEPRISEGSVSFAGRVTQKITVANRQTNSLQTLAGKLTLADLTASVTNLQLQKLAALVDCDLELHDGRRAEIKHLVGGLRHAGQPGGGFDVTGQYDLRDGAGQLSLKEVTLTHALLQPFLAPSLGERLLVSGALTLKGSAGYQPKGESTVKAEVQVTNFLMRDPAGAFPLTPLDVQAALDASVRQPATNAVQAQLRRLVLGISAGAKAGGSVELSGDFDSQKQAGKFALRVADLNQNALRPFLSAALGSKNLESVAINANGTGRFDLRGESALKADFTVTNLLVLDAKGGLPATPLSAQFAVDGAMLKQTLDLRQFSLTLSPTARAQNQLQLAGKADFTDTNALTAALRLTADALDLTPFYDLFNDPTKTNKPPAPAKPATGEPAPVKLAWKNTTLDVNIGRLFLREIAVSNLTAAARVDGARVQVQPLQFVLNGAPVRAAADLNLGVAGWQYDVLLKADKIPVEPLANTFSPTYKGQANGDLYADIQLKGAGTSGASLRQSLTGHATLSFTNANIQIVGPKARRNLGTIALALGVPEILNSPLNYLTADVRAGNGQLELRQFTAHSFAFIGESHGVVPITDAITNAPLALPLGISLPNSVARKFLLPSALASEPYSKLPAFVKVKGTLGNPEVEIDKFKLGELALMSTAGGGAGRAVESVKDIGKGAVTAVKEIGKDAGKAIGELGNLFGGKPATGTNAPPAGAVETNKPSKFNPFNFIPAPKKK